MSGYWKTIISFSAFFCLIAIFGEIPESIDILGLQIVYNQTFIKICFIVSFISLIGVVSDKTLIKNEKTIFSILGAGSSVVLGRLLFINISTNFYFFIIMSGTLSLILGIVFSTLWYYIFLTKRESFSGGQNSKLPVAGIAFKRAVIFITILFAFIIIISYLINNIFFRNKTHIILIQMFLLFFTPSLYRAVLILNGNFGSEKSRKSYQNQKSLKKIFDGHDYMYQVGGHTSISIPEPPIIYQQVMRGDLEAVKERIMKGDDLNCKSHGGWTILCQAVADDNFSIANFLLEKGANPNVLNVMGRSPMCYASRYGNKNMVKLLLQYGANPNLYDYPEEYGPLLISIYEGHVGIIELLLPGINLVKDKNDEYVEYKLALESKSPEIIELISKKINTQGSVESYYSFRK